MNDLKKKEPPWQVYTMRVDYALILSAGMGTRMGKIGKKLPKPLWPIYFKTLLELQVNYCRALGIKKIFVNTHFLAKEIHDFVFQKELFEDVVFLHEELLLDSGGAIHNMASRGDVGYQGNLLIVNVDQFLFFDKKYFAEGLAGLENSRAALFGIKVDKREKYNKIILCEECLLSIEKNNEESDYITYSGLGFLKLDGLEPVAGVSKFFESVANYKKERIQFIIPEKYEYWDFGTVEIYFENIKKIYENKKRGKKGHMEEFLDIHGAMRGDDALFFNPQLNSINIERQKHFIKDSIVANEVVHKI